jgi:hypothetical protein
VVPKQIVYGLLRDTIMRDTIRNALSLNKSRYEGQRPANKRVLVYVMSPSYSGSTLLTRIMAYQSKIATIGELKATGINDINTYRCSCGALFLECEFWNELAEKLHANDVPFNLHALETRIRSESSLVNSFLTPTLHGPILERLRRFAFLLFPAANTNLHSQLKRNAHIIEAICELQKCDVFLDESKDPLRALYFAQSDLWDFRVLQLVRDGRGAVNSDMKHNQRSMTVACREWNLKIDEMARFLDMVQCPVMQLTYESLCTDASAIISQVLEFAGIPESRGDLDISQDSQHIIGNDMRLKPMREVKLDEKWRTDLSRDELKTFYSLSGQRNKALGYDT